MSEPFLGEIRLVGFNFAPRGWAFCQGQVLLIAQNTALFSLLGTTYGGNGQTTFQLPDLRGRVPIGQGQGPGLPPYSLGQPVGVESTSLTINQMPAHNHPATVNVAVKAPVTDERATTNRPSGAVPAGGGSYAAGGTHDNALPVTASAAVGVNGGSQPVSLLQPSLVGNYVIALEGVFPPRS